MVITRQCLVKELGAHVVMISLLVKKCRRIQQWFNTETVKKTSIVTINVNEGKSVASFDTICAKCKKSKGNGKLD
jgi:hypothetical protein